MNDIGIPPNDFNGHLKLLVDMFTLWLRPCAEWHQTTFIPPISIKYRTLFKTMPNYSPTSRQVSFHVEYVIAHWYTQFVHLEIFSIFCGVQDCVDAIDGTIILAWVPSRKHGTYRSRKGTLAQNIMVACDFNLNFTFVLAGWEGSANDSRVFAEVLSNPEYHFPWPPQGKSCTGVILSVHYPRNYHTLYLANQTRVTAPGKYYVVDSGYTNFPGFLSPYHGERYHLPEWVGSNSNPSIMKELFNRRHATVRNIIERCFGSLKKRFAIIKGLMPNYKLPMQTDIVIACCVIHNFVRKHCMDDDIFESVVDPDYIPPPEEEGTSTQPIRRQMNNTNDGIWEQSCLRDSIAASLWGVDMGHVRSIHASFLAFPGQHFAPQKPIRTKILNIKLSGPL
ncbi:hypothetical protein DH2020_010761 [Rehmannia glutinosa]|uniref:DDE Tnp4 domain-containing protein n=1 Tax=Rehmannia glutinosa TaxID=99300 RepID=A0ABR0XBH4_REHGL